MDGTTMKVLRCINGMLVLFSSYCISGSEYDVRNSEIFDEAKSLPAVSYTTAANTISGNIQTLTTAILARGDNVESTCASTVGCPTVIEGIASTSSTYNFSLTTNGAVTDGSRGTGMCFDSTASTNSDGSQPWHCAAGTYCSTFGSGSTGWASQGTQRIFSRSFFLHDATGGVLVLYGLEPPLYTGSATSMQHISNARINGLVNAGDRIRLTVGSVQRYGVGAQSIAVVTDFSSLTRVSTANAISYQSKNTALAATDEGKVVRVEGTITIPAAYAEISCVLSGTASYSFQFNHDDGYVGEITDSSNNKYCFKLSYNVGAGTLSGFDVADMFSYNVSKNAKVRITGPVFFPRNRRAGVGIKPGIDAVTTDPRISTSGLCIAVDKRFQVETIK
ncbi:MAG: hypothetical protein KF713_18585 [Turneriella sp.]|nr:hypothetical protein [Turneriella sp.]